MTHSSKLTVTSKGQVTLRRSVLDHLGVAPGDPLVVDLLPDGRVEIRAAPRGSIEDFIGFFARRGQPYDGPPVSIEEMNQIIADGWAGKV